MFYETSLTIPAETSSDDPAEIELRVTHGVVHRVEVEFAPGPSWRANVVILYRNHQVWPTNPDGTFASDSHTIGFDDYYEMFYSPYTFVIQGWSPAAVKDHTVRVRLGVLPQIIAEHIYGKTSKIDQALLREAFGLPSEG